MNNNATFRDLYDYLKILLPNNVTTMFNRCVDAKIENNTLVPIKDTCAFRIKGLSTEKIPSGLVISRRCMVTLNLYAGTSSDDQLAGFNIIEDFVEKADTLGNKLIHINNKELFIQGTRRVNDYNIHYDKNMNNVFVVNIIISFR